MRPNQDDTDDRERIRIDAGSECVVIVVSETRWPVSADPRVVDELLEACDSDEWECEKVQRDKLNRPHFPPPKNTKPRPAQCAPRVPRVATSKRIAEMVRPPPTIRVWPRGRYLARPRGSSESFPRFFLDRLANRRYPSRVETTNAKGKP